MQGGRFFLFRLDGADLLAFNNHVGFVPVKDRVDMLSLPHGFEMREAAEMADDMGYCSVVNGGLLWVDGQVDVGFLAEALGVTPLGLGLIVDFRSQ